MKKRYLFLMLSILVFSCTENSKAEKEAPKDDFFNFDFFEEEDEMDFDEEEEIIEDDYPIPAKEIEKEENIEKIDVLDKLEVVEEEEIEIDDEEEIEDENLEDDEVTIDYSDYNVRFKSKETLTINEVLIEKRLEDKGLIKRYKSPKSYFDIYDMDKSIDWSGAGNFAEFGQGFYERSKNVYGGKFVKFANAKAFIFRTKVSFDDKHNYSNIKKLKSDIESTDGEKVDAIVVFFGKGNYGYRFIYEANDDMTLLISESMELY